MPKDADGNWYPDLFQKQVDVLNSQARVLLVEGPRISGKTTGALHRLVRHMWETPDARVAMFSKTIKNSKEGGTWALLHSVVLKEWIDAKIGLKYTTKNSEKAPGFKLDSLSRTLYFRIRNVHGGESTCMLFSLDHDSDIEDKIKEMEFSMIYFSELSKFFDRKVLGVTLLSLRMRHIPYEAHMWLADTNPADDGEQSWIYKAFHVELSQDYETYVVSQKKQGLPILDEALFTKQKSERAVIAIKPDENIKLDKRQLDELKAQCAYDAGLWAKYVEGKWIYGEGDASCHFRSFFKRNLHVIGDVSPLDEEDWIYANPSPGSFELLSGWDLGEVNHAVAIVERKLYPVRSIIGGREVFTDLSHFTVIDEFLSLKQEMSIAEVTDNVMEMIEAHEKRNGIQYNLDHSWSDQSSIEKYSASAATFPYLQVYGASGNRIFLRGVPKAKGKGSVRHRVSLIKMLLHAGRLKVSAHCFHTIEMLENLKKGKTEYINQEDPMKHIFDALSYAMFMEIAEELEVGPEPGGRLGGMIVQVG